MATPTISPQEAVQAGCTVSQSSRTDSWTYADDFFGTDTIYTLVATPATGWRVANITFSRNDGSRTREYSTDIYDEGVVTFTHRYYYDSIYTYGGVSFAETVTSVTVTFEKTDAKITVNLVVCPGKTKTDGCDVYPQEKIEESGRPGYSRTFNVLAVVPYAVSKKWKFKNWTDEDGNIVSESSTYSFSKTFSYVDQEFTYYANFVEETGEILHGASGTILHGASGTIIFKG